LWERKDDIVPLAQHFISHYNLKFRKSIKDLNKEAKELFLDYNWPGNVRELKNALERAMIFEEDSFISTKYIPIRLNSNSSSLSKPSSDEFSDKNISLPEMEKKLLLNALKKAMGNKTKAAKLLNITRDKLRYRIKKNGIKPKDFSFSG
jgi:transcriptional regulator with PAS, ATPase and Fis domain